MSLQDLKENGFCIIKGYAAGNEVLDTVKLKFNEMASRGEKLKSNDNHFLVVEQPYLNCPPSLDLAIDKNIVSLAEEYLGNSVYLGTCNLRRSHITKEGPVSTNLFHMDENCGKGVRLIKAFYYLNDVDEDGGPFEYIKGSHNKRIPGWQNRIRWSDNEIYEFYGKENAIRITAQYGDLIMADTTGYHRGLQVRSKTRDMLTMNYVIHKELHGECHISKEAGLNPLFKYAKMI